MADAPSGTYLLLLKVAAVADIDVGKLGELAIKPGFYVYSGSAFGPGGLNARIGRHLRPLKKLRWHIDYLRREVDDIAAYFQIDSRNECAFAKALGTAGGEIPLKGFGSSDCRCVSHLFYFKLLAPFTKFLLDHDMKTFNGASSLPVAR